MIKSFTRNNVKESGGFTIAGILIFVTVIFFLIWIGWRLAQTNEPPKPHLTVDSAVAPSPSPKQQVEISETTVNLATFSGWTSGSDGYTWNSAPESDKRDLFDRLASGSKSGKSAQFFYDALNAAYNTSDVNVLESTLRFSAQYIEDSQ